MVLVLLAACSGVSSDPAMPDAADIDATGVDAPPTVVSGNKRIFVTDTTYVGGFLGGLAGADQKCEARAAAAGLAGTYKAWLSDRTVSAAGRLTHSTGAYLLVDGSMVAANFDGLVSGTVQRAIDLDPFGATYTAPTKCSVVGGLAAVWTGTGSNGSLAAANLTCVDWTKDMQDGLIGNGSVGNAKGTTKWTHSNCALSCTDTAALYCVEQ